MLRITLGPKTILVAAALVAALAVIAGILLGWWDWKTLIGWRALVGYIEPEDATNRKDAVQVYALIVAGAVATVTAAVGLGNLHFTRKNLNQQRELEDDRAQSTALQDYYEQMGKLLTEHDLLYTKRDDIRLLARAQTLTVLEGLDPPRKDRLLRFLVGSDLVQKREDRAKSSPLIDLAGTHLSGTDLSGADLSGANLGGATLSGATLSGATLSGAVLSEATLIKATLTEADLRGADLRGADLRGALVSAKRLDMASSLQGATMPDGEKHD